MKIIQILPRIEGCGITRYVIEMNSALKTSNVDVDLITFPADSKSVDDKVLYQTISDIRLVEYCDETYDLLNSADYVFIHSLVDNKADETYKKLFFDMLKYKITTKKVYFVNDRKMMSIRTYYGDWTKDVSFLNSIDYICTFSSDTPIYKTLKELYGNDIVKKYIHLEHPYKFDDTKSLWQNFDKKYKRITYLGRFATFKDPCRLIRAKEYWDREGYQAELRGIARCIATAFQPDLYNKIDEHGNRVGISDKTLDISPKYKREHGYLNDDMVHVTDRGDRIYVFREYKRDEGLKAISFSQFGANFYHLNDNASYGDSVEYSIAEMIDAGTIPVMDLEMGQACYYNIKGEPTKDTLYDKGMGLFLAKDLSNIEEVLSKMNDIISSEDKYNEFRNMCFETYKKHYDPKSVVTKLLKDLSSNDTKITLEEENTVNADAIALF